MFKKIAFEGRESVATRTFTGYPVVIYCKFGIEIFG